MHTRAQNHTSGPGQDFVSSQGDFSAGQRLADTHLEPWYSHYNTLRLNEDFLAGLMAENLNCKHELL